MNTRPSLLIKDVRDLFFDLLCDCTAYKLQAFEREIQAAKAGQKLGRMFSQMAKSQ